MASSSSEPQTKAEAGAAEAELEVVAVVNLRKRRRRDWIRGLKKAKKEGLYCQRAHQQNAALCCWQAQLPLPL
ncbi:hypothetical protein RJ639_011406 [Escallonia herrerae]|uniref:Uncharacterized protein n=1 Tax=Escallonia herrerae TaxID=1293975 RepID=A0AA88VJK0_9ASTE|nr:hypothetical protein RJ639_011406 [Escallonia herrerae]